MNLSVIVASSGRLSLERATRGAYMQMEYGDELLASVQFDCPWGHAARNQLMPAARGDFLLFMDDDDTYMPEALETVRQAAACDPERIHMFKMRYTNGQELWQRKEVAVGNVSTVMFAVPNVFSEGSYPHWGDRYEGDFDFIHEACTLLGEPVWHPEVIALVRPD